MIQFREGKVTQRDALAAALSDLAFRNDRIFVLDADLSNSSGMSAFKEMHGDRFVNCGIQEANMFGVAAGLASEGYVPFVHSFAAFASRRALDQLFVSILYNHCPVKIISSDPGICNSANGGTHLSYEDVGVMTSFPDIKVVDFTDSVMIERLIPEIAGDKYPYYLRMQRKKSKVLYSETQKFKVGKAVSLSEGKDLAILCNSSLALEQALLAADKLEKAGIQAEVVDFFTLSPIDCEKIVDCARKYPLLVTVENSVVHNGLGYAVAYQISQMTARPKLVTMGIPQTFGEVGPLDYLMKKYGLDSESIYSGIRQAIDQIL